MVVSYQWLHDKVRERREAKLRAQSQENWLSQLEDSRTYADGAIVQIKTQDGDPGQSDTPPEEIKGLRGVIRFLHGWVATQGQSRGIYAVYVGDQTYLVDENWLEPTS